MALTNLIEQELEFLDDVAAVAEVQVLQVRLALELLAVALAG